VTEVVIPKETALEPAYPNPFNPETKIAYRLSRDAEVTLRVVDITGRTVQTIIRGEWQKAGNYHIFWNGREDTGQMAASGVYILMFQAGEMRKVQKVMLVR
jgi:flagellar hook assembly protein FlgD